MQQLAVSAVFHCLNIGAEPNANFHSATPACQQSHFSPGLPPPRFRPRASFRAHVAKMFGRNTQIFISALRWHACLNDMRAANFSLPVSVSVFPRVIYMDCQVCGALCSVAAILCTQNEQSLSVPFPLIQRLGSIGCTCRMSVVSRRMALSTHL